MIRTEPEYKLAVQRLREEKERIMQQRESYVQAGLSGDELERVMAPLESFHLELKEEIEDYERLIRGEFDEVRNLRGIGTMLVRTRIASGLSQKELADRLDVDPSQVSRDERNEYYGVTVERASRVLNALGYELRSVVEQRESVDAH